MSDWRDKWPVGTLFLHSGESFRIDHHPLHDNYVAVASTWPKLGERPGVFCLDRSTMDKAMKIEFIKHDSTKPKMHKLPWGAVVAIRRVMDYGAGKYGEDNWRKASREDSQRYLDACMRHLAQMAQGEETDDESGHPHAWHALTSLAMWVELNKPGKVRK